MSRKYVVVFLILVFSAAASADTIEGSYIIEYEQPQGFTTMSHGQMDKGIQQALENGEKKHSYQNVLQGSSVQDASQQEIERIENLPFVKEVHQSQRYELLTEDSYEIINADEIGHNSEIGLTGEGIKISIIDTGLDYTHEAFGSCEWDSLTGLEDCDKVAEWEDFTDSSNSDPNDVDDPEHGTHVSGTASGNASDFKGLAPESQVFAYNVFETDSDGDLTADPQDIIAAIDASVENDADIISMSLGGSGNPSDSLSTAVDDAYDNGVLPVIAAGNDGDTKETIMSPGVAENTLTVGASGRLFEDTKADQIASFSSRGHVFWDNNYISKPEVAAPGVAVNSAVPGGGYEEKDGTSMATPVVSGAAALLLEQEERPPSDIKNLLIGTAEDLGEKSWAQGSGRINVSKAYENRGVSTDPVKFDFKNVETVSESSKNIEIHNTRGEEVEVNLGFGKAYNMTELEEDNERAKQFSANESEFSLGEDESKTVKLSTLSASEELFTAELWINKSLEEESYSNVRTVSGFIDYQAQPEGSVSLPEIHESDPGFDVETSDFVNLDTSEGGYLKVENNGQEKTFEEIGEDSTFVEQDESLELNNEDEITVTLYETSSEENLLDSDTQSVEGERDEEVSLGEIINTEDSFEVTTFNFTNLNRDNGGYLKIINQDTSNTFEIENPGEDTFTVMKEDIGSFEEDRDFTARLYEDDSEENLLDLDTETVQPDLPRVSINVNSGGDPIEEITGPSGTVSVTVVDDQGNQVFRNRLYSSDEKIYLEPEEYTVIVSNDRINSEIDPFIFAKDLSLTEEDDREVLIEVEESESYTVELDSEQDLYKGEVHYGYRTNEESYASALISLFDDATIGPQSFKIKDSASERISYYALSWGTENVKSFEEEDEVSLETQDEIKSETREIYYGRWESIAPENFEMETTQEIVIDDPSLESPDIDEIIDPVFDLSEIENEAFLSYTPSLRTGSTIYIMNEQPEGTVIQTSEGLIQKQGLESLENPLITGSLAYDGENLVFEDLVQDWSGNSYFEGDQNVTVFVNDSAEDFSNQSIDYWESFEREISGETDLSINLPTDLPINSEIDIDAEFEAEEALELPKIENIQDHDPLLTDEWSATFVTGETTDISLYYYDEGWIESDTGTEDATLNLDEHDLTSLNVRAELEKEGKKTNYTFTNLAREEEKVDIQFNETQNIGNTTFNGESAKWLGLDRQINQETVQSEYTNNNGVFSFQSETCRLRKNSIDWSGYLHYDMDELVYNQSEPLESLTSFSFEEVVLAGSQNNITASVSDDCGFDYQLATNETGDMENRTVETSEVDGDKVFQWENNGIEAEETIEFELWLGEGDEWYSSDTESFTVAEPSFVQTGLFIDDQVVEEEEFNVSSEIENVGGIEGNFTADLIIQDEDIDDIDITEEALIDPGEKVNITFTETIDEPGNYDADSVNETVNFDVLNSAEFEITEPSINTTEIFTSQTVELSANIENIGEVAGNTSLVFSVGSEEQNQTLELESGETENVHENITVNEEGTFTPSINDSETDQLEVNEPFVNITETEIITTDSGLITVNATLNNTDPVSTTKELELEFNDTVQKTENFGLESEEEKNVTLEKNWNRTELKTVKLNGEEIGEFQLDPFAEFKNLEPDSEAFDEDEVVEFTVDVEAVGEGTVNVDTANNVYEENLDPGLNSFEYEESFSPGEYDWFAEAEIQEEIFESETLFFDIDELTDDSDDGGSSSSGNGGGSGAAPPSAAPDPEITLEQEDDSVRILDIFEGEHDLEFNDTQLPVTGLTFTAEEEGSIEFDATELEHTGSMESLFEVDTELENSFTLEYKVSREWLNETNFESGDISLYRWEDSWNDQGSETTGGDEDYIHYRTELDSFSTFGIGSSQACYSMEEVDAVADNSCETYGNICEVSEEAETVDSCQNWERENEVRNRISQIRDEGGDEETLEQAEQAVETGDFEEAENLTEQAQSGPEIPRITSSTIPVLPLIGLFIGLTGLTAAGYKLIPVYREKKLVKRINRLSAKVTEKGNKGEEVQELAEKVGKANKALLRENYGMAEKLVNQAESSLEAE